MLALKVVIADRGSAPSLVFDEIDTAVGGAVADAIGVASRGSAGASRFSPSPTPPRSQHAPTTITSITKE